ncbi:MAG: hypothetical protein Q8P15_00415, partial [Nanoarchaeota archaeon]|nr:hypothetical protein [Nanoarchaeota archaeon]
MKKELLEFINENAFSPFTSKRTAIKNEDESIYKTRDARAIHTKLLSKISSNFYFEETSNLLNFFSFTSDINVIKRRQDFIREIKEIIPNEFLSQINAPKKWWKPKYGI